MIIIPGLIYGQLAELDGIIINGIDKTKSIGVVIRLVQGSKIVSEAVSDDVGKFKITNLEPGVYDLKLSYIGYNDHTAVGIVLEPNELLERIIYYPCPIGKSESDKVCPYGHRSNIIPIKYGLPSLRMMRRAERGRIYLGGCIITECDPKWYCKKHKISF